MGVVEGGGEGGGGVEGTFWGGGGGGASGGGGGGGVDGATGGRVRIVWCCLLVVVFWTGCLARLVLVFGGEGVELPRGLLENFGCAGTADGDIGDGIRANMRVPIDITVAVALAVGAGTHSSWLFGYTIGIAGCWPPEALSAISVWTVFDAHLIHQIDAPHGLYLVGIKVQTGVHGFADHPAEGNV